MYKLALVVLSGEGVQACSRSKETSSPPILEPLLDGYISENNDAGRQSEPQSLTNDEQNSNRVESLRPSSSEALDDQVSTTARFHRKRSEFTSGLLLLLDFFTKYIYEGVGTDPGKVLYHFSRLQEVLTFPVLNKSLPACESTATSVGVPDIVRGKLPRTDLEFKLSQELLKLAQQARTLLSILKQKRITNPSLSALELSASLSKLNGDIIRLSKKVGRTPDEEITVLLPRAAEIEGSTDNVPLIKFQELLLSSIKSLELIYGMHIKQNSSSQRDFNLDYDNMRELNAHGREDNLIMYAFLLVTVESRVLLERHSMLQHVNGAPPVSVAMQVINNPEPQAINMNQMRYHSMFTYEFATILRLYQLEKEYYKTKYKGKWVRETWPTVHLPSLNLSSIGQKETPLVLPHFDRERIPQTGIELEMVRHLILAARKLALLAQLTAGKDLELCKSLSVPEMNEFVCNLVEKRNDFLHKIYSELRDLPLGNRKRKLVYDSTAASSELIWGKCMTLVEFQGLILKDTKKVQDDIDKLITAKLAESASFIGQGSAARQAGIRLPNHGGNIRDTSELLSSSVSPHLSNFELTLLYSLLLTMRETLTLDLEVTAWSHK